MELRIPAQPTPEAALLAGLLVQIGRFPSLDQRRALLRVMRRMCDPGRTSRGSDLRGLASVVEALHALQSHRARARGLRGLAVLVGL